MIKRLVMVVLLLITLPVVSAQFSAQAGHSSAGGYCQCGCAACICDPGEEAGDCGGLNSRPAMPDPGKEVRGLRDGSIKGETDMNLGSLILFFSVFASLAFVVVRRQA